MKSNSSENLFEAFGPENLPLLLSAKQAPLLGLSRSGFYRMVNDGEISVVIIGGRKFIRREDFFTWVNEHTV